VPGHEGIVGGNEMADQLPRRGSEHPFTGPEPDCGIAIGVANKAVKDWMNRNDKKYWEAIIGVKQAKGFIPGPSARRMKGTHAHSLALSLVGYQWILKVYGIAGFLDFVHCPDRKSSF
jgi:hypothetical protein